MTGNTRHTRPENRAFYPALDGLRAVAFLMVFCQHYGSVPWGWAGVNVFFVLSGFLITGILWDTRDDPHRARNFYVRRTLRIFPLYYGIFLGLLLLYPMFHWHWNWYWAAWPLYLGNFLRFVSPEALVWESPLRFAADAWLKSEKHHTVLFLGHLWSLCVEEQFYLFWPWIVFRVRNRKALVSICGSAVIGVPLLRLAAQAAAPSWMLQGELLYRATPFQLDSLLLGGLIAILWREMDRDILLAIGRRAGGLVAAGIVLALAWALYFKTEPGWRVGYVYPVWRLTWGLTLVNAFTGALILCCLQTGGRIARALSVKPLRWLGRISYGAYVFHDILHNFCANATTGLAKHIPVLLRHETLATLMLAFVSTMLIAWLSYRFIESPFLNLKEKWTKR